MLDIEKFYDRCTREYVYRFFIEKLKTPKDVAEILTDITTLDGKLPTGSPSSQILAFHAYEDMFSAIADIAGANERKFTLYIDDTTTSSEVPFSKNKLLWEIETILKMYGHKSKKNKTEFYSKNKSKPITGSIITTDNRQEPPNSLQKKVYDEFQKAKQKRYECAGDIDFQNELAVAIGRMQSLRSINPNRFQNEDRILRQIQKESRLHNPST